MKRYLQARLFTAVALLVFFLLPSVGWGEEQIGLSLTAEPQTYMGGCPATVRFVGKIAVAKPTAVICKFVRSDAVFEPARLLIFDGPGEKEVNTTLTTSRNASGWVKLKIIDPVDVESSAAHFRTDCTSGRLGGAKGATAGDRFLYDFIAALDGTVIQISHTDHGQALYGDPVPVWHRAVNIPARKESTAYGKTEMEEQAKNECEKKYRADPRRQEDCLAAVKKRFEGEWRVLKPAYQSYVKFCGPLKKVNKNLQDKVLDIPIYEKTLPKKASAALTVLSGGIYTTDKVRILVNNLHTKIDAVNASASIRDGGINLSLAVASSQPTVLCDGHAEWFLGLFDDWADVYCPDLDIQNMKIGLHFVPAVTPDGRLTYSDVKVTLTGDLVTSVSGDLADFFAGYVSDLKEAVESELRAKLMSDEVKTSLSQVLSGLVKKEFGRDRIKSAAVRGSALVVTFANAPSPPVKSEGRPATGADPLAKD